MLILGIHTGHDAAACVSNDGELIAYCKEERLTRKKNDGGRFALTAIDEVLAVAGCGRSEIDAVALSRMHLPLDCYLTRKRRPLLELSRRLRGVSQHRQLFSEMVRQRESDEAKIVDSASLKKRLRLRSSADALFVNHHYSHVLGTFRYTDWRKDALFVSCDAAGDGVHYSAYTFDGTTLSCLLGGDSTLLTGMQNPAASIGIAYSHVTRLLGYKINRHEGKITGLAAFGEPVAGKKIRDSFIVTDHGRVESIFTNAALLRHFLAETIAPLSREDAAASIQYGAEELIVEWVKRLLTIFPARYIGMSGGVFANVRINQRVAETAGVEEVFIFPPMGDEGLPVGHCAEPIVRKKGIGGLARSRLRDVYLGRDYTASDLVRAAHRTGFSSLRQTTPRPRPRGYLPKARSARCSPRMEMGPRALGARSILASPLDRGLNDSLNKRLDRTEFMPFAPYVLDEDAEAVFEIDGRNREACRFMTITTQVRPRHREQISAVVYVDGTARPQIIEKQTNPLYYEVLAEFKKRTGIPCLVNTSFNVHEEPIINTPSEALSALRDRRIDFLICETGIVLRDEHVRAGPHSKIGDRAATDLVNGR